MHPRGDAPDFHSGGMSLQTEERTHTTVPLKKALEELIKVYPN